MPGWFSGVGWLITTLNGSHLARDATYFVLTAAVAGRTILGALFSIATAKRPSWSVPRAVAIHKNNAGTTVSQMARHERGSGTSQNS